MNRLLTLIGIVFLAAALIIPLVIPKRQAKAMPPDEPAEPSDKTQTTSVHQLQTGSGAGPVTTIDESHDHSHDHQHLYEPAPVGVPAIASEPLIIDEHATFEQAAGRSSALAIPRQVPTKAVAFKALPRAGQSEILTCSTLGGVERQTNQRANWHLDNGEAINFTVDGTQAVLTISNGRWAVQPGDLPSEIVSALKDQARIIHALIKAFGTPGTIAPAEARAIAGDDFQPWHHEQHDLLLVGPSEDGTPPATYPPRPGAWNDLRLHLTDSGHPLSAERLVASPATATEPGYLVRRIILRFDVSP